MADDFVKPSLLPPALAGDLSMRALEALVARMADLDLEPTLVYDFEHVAESALPHLGEQFHVMGEAEWQLAITDMQRRQLLSRAVVLHRHKGTPWAVCKALQTVGFGDTQIIERPPGAHWAEFDVHVQISSRPGDETIVQRIVALIDNNKPARSHLRTLRLTLYQSGQLHMLAAQAGADITTVQPLQVQPAPVSAHLCPVIALALGEIATLYPPPAQPASIAARTYRISAMVLREHTAVHPCHHQP